VSTAFFLFNKRILELRRGMVGAGGINDDGDEVAGFLEPNLLLSELLREDDEDLLDSDVDVGDDAVGIGLGGKGKATCIVGFAFIKLVDFERCGPFGAIGDTSKNGCQYPGCVDNTGCIGC
jgi:hypothetical protein